MVHVSKDGLLNPANCSGCGKPIARGLLTKDQKAYWYCGSCLSFDIPSDGGRSKSKAGAGEYIYLSDGIRAYIRRRGAA